MDTILCILIKFVLLGIKILGKMENPCSSGMESMPMRFLGRLGKNPKNLKISTASLKWFSKGKENSKSLLGTIILDLECSALATNLENHMINGCFISTVTIVETTSNLNQKDSNQK